MAWVDLTIQEYTVSGSPTLGPFSFNGILTLNEAVVPVETQMVVSVDGVIKTEGAANDYTISGTDVTFTAGHGSIQVGETVRLARSTKNDARYVDWTDAARTTEADMDLDSNQLFFLIQEALDTAHNAMVKNLAGQWDAQNVTIQDLAPGVNSTDAVTLGQVNAIFGDGVPTNIDDGILLTFTGDGATTAFTLTDVRNSATLQWFAWVDSVIQHGNYVVNNISGADDTLTFDVAPITGAEIVLHAVKGTVASTLDPNTITGDMIQDNAIDEDHLKFSAGVAQRFIEIDTAGDPTLTTLDHDDIQDFDNGVKENEWRAMAVPTSSVTMNGQQLKDVADGTASTDAVNKSQLDGAVGDPGFDWVSMPNWRPPWAATPSQTVAGDATKTLRGFIWTGTYSGSTRYESGGAINEPFTVHVALPTSGVLTGQRIMINEPDSGDHINLENWLYTPTTDSFKFERVNGGSLKVTVEGFGAGGNDYNNQQFILFRN